MFRRMINFWRGVIDLSVESSHCEQILNVIHRNRISFWKVRRVDEQHIRFTIYEKDLPQVQTICTRYFSELKVLSVFSKSKILNFYKKRWGLWVGIILIGICFGVLNLFVWDVEVKGCKIKTTESEIINQFKDLGFGIGTFRFGIDISQLENEFMLQNKNVIWVSVNMHFTTADIEIAERDENVKIYDFTTPCDVYAKRDGVITSMMVPSGTPLVKVGDAVCAGDMLVSREYTGRYGETIIVHAMANITAKTTRVISVETPLEQEVHTPTGRDKIFRTINLFKLKIPLYFKHNIYYNDYDKTESVSIMKIGRYFALPVSLSREKYTEVTVKNVQIAHDTAKATALTLLEQQEKRQLAGTDILSKDIREETRDGKLILTATYTCLEDIAVSMGDK